MKIMLFDISEKIDEPIIEALRRVKKAADTLDISFFVVGATARDIILKHCYRIETPRMTRDIDLGVNVASWELFDRLINSLVSKEKFATTKDKQRLKFGVLQVDLVPFGIIAGTHSRISWPPEHKIFMSILGFQEAYEHAITVRVSSKPILDIKIPSLPGLALMKLIAWKEKYPERKKDAQDLLFIMHKYEEAGVFDKLYSEEQDLLKAEDFDTRIASIRLLGRNMALIADHDTVGEVINILNAETENESGSKLVIDMVTSGSFYYDEQYEEIKTQIEKLKEGFADSTRNIRK